jgi:hypothetical protein
MSGSLSWNIWIKFTIQNVYAPGQITSMVFPYN